LLLLYWSLLVALFGSLPWPCRLPGACKTADENTQCVTTTRQAVVAWALSGGRRAHLWGLLLLLLLLVLVLVRKSPGPSGSAGPAGEAMRLDAARGVWRSTHPRALLLAPLSCASPCGC
jgi:hypothetical protein